MPSLEKHMVSLWAKSAFFQTVCCLLGQCSNQNQKAVGLLEEKSRPSFWSKRGCKIHHVNVRKLKIIQLHFKRMFTQIKQTMPQILPALRGWSRWQMKAQLVGHWKFSRRENMRAVKARLFRMGIQTGDNNYTTWSKKTLPTGPALHKLKNSRQDDRMTWYLFNVSWLLLLLPSSRKHHHDIIIFFLLYFIRFVPKQLQNKRDYKRQSPELLDASLHS